MAWVLLIASLRQRAPSGCGKCVWSLACGCRLREWVCKGCDNGFLCLGCVLLGCALAGWILRIGHITRRATPAQHNGVLSLTVSLHDYPTNAEYQCRQRCSAVPVPRPQSKCAISEAEAERLAADIEGRKAAWLHMAEERGQHVDDSGVRCCCCAISVCCAFVVCVVWLARCQRLLLPRFLLAGTRLGSLLRKCQHITTHQGVW